MGVGLEQEAGYRGMDSRAVNRLIKVEIHPFLKEQGFTRFTSRNSWRYGAGRIDVINFQSFNDHCAAVMGCTTYSFALNLGCYFTEVPYCYGEGLVKSEDGELRPGEAQCPFRGRLQRGFPQPESDSRELWYVDPDGRYLEQAVRDAGSAIAHDGLPWFERLAHPSEALRVLTEDDETARLWGFGAKRSPCRHYFTGYLALTLGRHDVAREHLRRALASGSFDEVAERLGRDLKKATRPGFPAGHCPPVS